MYTDQSGYRCTAFKRLWCQARMVGRAVRRISTDKNRVRLFLHNLSWNNTQQKAVKKLPSAFIPIDDALSKTG